MGLEAGVGDRGAVLTSSGQSQDDRRGPVGKEGLHRYVRQVGGGSRQSPKEVLGCLSYVSILPRLAECLLPLPHNLTTLLCTVIHEPLATSLRQNSVSGNKKGCPSTSAFLRF